jgi:choline dehydrogenase-like flavoprotein
MIFVIGSGPAAAACVSALVARGLKVTVLDAGIELEAEYESRIQSYRENGDLSALEDLKSKVDATAKGIPLKLSFGSDFPYRDACDQLHVTENTSGALPSFALGGLSNVWGAAMLPYRDADINDWPIRTSDLSPHYKAIARLTGMTASTTGTMDNIFPSFIDIPGHLDLNSQGSALWKDLESAAERLQRKGILFGRGRLAVRTKSETAQGCDYKGLCMSGCPDNYIYNSRKTIRDLVKLGEVEYRRDVVVRKIIQASSGLEIECSHRITKEPIRILAKKVFLAAGVIPSARILMETFNLRGQKLVMRDSQYFLFPLFRMKGASGVASEKSNTLSQIFLELVEGSGIQRSSHLQLYGYNEMIGQALRATLGIAGRLAPRLTRFLEERMMIAQGYLHSDLSGTIETWLEHTDHECKSPPMHIRAESNPSTRRHVLEVVRKIMIQSHRLKAFPLLPLLQIAPPVRGFHTGGTFPMRKHPRELETDIYGQPSGFPNLHVVDSSILPSIPATTITFSIMANAHRIGSTCEI